MKAFTSRISLTVLSSVLVALFLIAAPFSRASGAEEAPKTPSHVYQQTERIIIEIKILRKARSASDTPRDPGVTPNKLPLHVYGKSLEVLEKIGRFQQTLGMTPASVAQIPLTKITPTKVFGSTENILSEIGRVKSKLGITDTISDPPFVEGKTPSDVYENMWRASYLLDGLVGQISPSNVFRNTKLVLAELKLVTNHMGKPFSDDAPGPIAGKIPEDVNNEGFKALYLLAKLERVLKMKRLRVPDPPAGKILPSDVYDTTNTMLAELVRIKVKLSITESRQDIAVVEGKKPSDVHAQMRLITENLRTLTKK